MTILPLTHPDNIQTMQRDQLVFLIKTALSVGENRYAQRLALSWLPSFPGDLEICLYNAQASIQLGQVPQAITILESILEVDPENLQAQIMLAHSRETLGQKDDIAKFCVVALGGRPLAKSFLPKWTIALRESKQIHEKTKTSGKSIDNSEMQEATLKKAEGLVHQALVENPPTPLAAIAHLKLNISRSDLPQEAILDLAKAYHQRWPKCMVFTLVMADALMENGQAEQAVAWLHQAVSEDVMGLVARRLWGANHPYISMWPEELSIDYQSTQRPQDIPIPAAVSRVLGWNLLSSGSNLEENNDPAGSEADQKNFEPTKINVTVPLHRFQSSVSPTHTRKRSPLPKYQIPETLVSVQQELENIAQKLKQPSLGRSDGRFPVYVIFTTYAGLVERYGLKQATLVDLEMHRLARSISQRKGWRAMVYYADQPQRSTDCASFQLSPSSPKDPWELKLALVDLDAVLGKNGEMIGAVLIVGGPEIVPFHRLPNPVDDTDFDVPSDNPYATRDDNYFIPEWPVGRLPGGSSDEGQILLDSLCKIAIYHNNQTQENSSHRLWWNNLLNFIVTSLPWRPKELPSMGYSAAIWRRASLSVFRSIGEPGHLLVSPPLQVQVNSNSSSNGKKSTLHLPPAKLGYFNLHGLPDSAEWYGQRDTYEQGSDIDFPIALRPEDIGAKNGSPNGKTHQVVFSEACYGAHIFDKSSDQAISLKFIKSGTNAFVGSTVTSYGSIASPLIAADLLGRAFWQFLGEGYPAGEALRRAKIILAKEMHRRQGYLDGEDQKTLISFVLYGDPLFQAYSAYRSSKMVIRSMASPAQVKTVCDKGNAQEELNIIPPEVIHQVKYVVSQYLPGMKGAQVTYHAERAGCNGGGHACPTAQFGAKSLPNHAPHRKVVVLKQQITQAKATHQQFARLTIDEHGKLVKLVVSR